jgi:hypothetical protein
MVFAENTIEEKLLYAGKIPLSIANLYAIVGFQKKPTFCSLPQLWAILPNDKKFN